MPFPCVWCTMPFNIGARWQFMNYIDMLVLLSYSSVARQCFYFRFCLNFLSSPLSSVRIKKALNNSNCSIKNTDLLNCRKENSRKWRLAVVKASKQSKWNAQICTDWHPGIQRRRWKQKTFSKEKEQKTHERKREKERTTKHHGWKTQRKWKKKEF